MVDLTFPLKRRFRVTDDFQAHLDRDPPSTAPGTDFAAPSGEPVFSVGDGYVEVAEGRGAGGLRVWINHGRAGVPGSPVVKSYFAHLSSLEVVKLQVVKRGEKIGEVGSTGNSTGPHLHLSIKFDREYIDPEDVLPEPC